MPSAKSSIAHVICIIICSVLLMACTALLSDGRSVITVKPKPPIVTVPSIANASIAALLGPTYGIGLHHDQSGRFWDELASDTAPTLSAALSSLGVAATLAALPTLIGDDSLKHPVAFLECKELQNTGIFTMYVAYVGLAGAFVALIVHAIALPGNLIPVKVGKMILLVLHAVLIGGFVVAVACAFEVYSKNWTCNNPLIPKLKLKDSFDLNFGIPFAIIGMVACLIDFVFVLILVSSSEEGSTFKSTASSSSSSAATPGGDSRA